MKIAKILLILLIPTLGLVGCKKSSVKPGCNDHSATETTTAPADKENNTSGNRTAKLSDLVPEGDGEEGGTDIIGSGDDDREGGKQKKIGAK